MILGTAGHIDHGKTSLVRALTGVDTDRLPEEKRRGITIDLGFAPLRLDDGTVLGVVDVPGHEAFVRTMLAGASGIDLAMLVIAADEGVMPQTREHLAILGLLGVRGGVVALTKRDLVDEEWLALVEDDVRGALDGSPLAGAPMIPTSVVGGQGIDALRAAIGVCAAAVPRRDGADLFRMPIDRAFTVRGTGTVVTGTVWSGTVAKDATVRVLPAGLDARVRSVQSHGSAVDVIRPGTRAAIALAGVELDAVSRGAVLVADPSWRASTVVRAEVALLDDAPAPLRPRTRVRLHLATQDVGARVVAAGGELAPGARAPARVVLDAPLVARSGDRFVLRASSPVVTIGGGVITDPLPPHTRARPGQEALHTPAERLVWLVRESGAEGVSRAELAVRIGATPAMVNELLASGVLQHVEIAGRIHAGSVLDELAERLRGILASFHARSPLEPAASLQAVRAALRAPFGLVDEVVRRGVAAGEIAVDGGAIRLAGYEPVLTSGQRAAREALREILRQAGREPSSTGELVARFGGDVPALLRILERDGVVVQVEEDRYYDAEVMSGLVQSLRTRLEPGREYSPAELRDVLGVSRKYLIPLLEHCDRRGITDRRSGGRVLGGT